MKKAICHSCKKEVKSREQWLKELCPSMKSGKTGHGLTPKQIGLLGGK